MELFTKAIPNDDLVTCVLANAFDAKNFSGVAAAVAAIHLRDVEHRRIVDLYTIHLFFPSSLAFRLASGVAGT